MKFEIGDRVVFYRRYEGCMDDHSMKMIPLGAVGTVKNTFNNRPPGQQAPLVQFDGFEFASVADKDSLRIDVAMPKPGTLFRVKAGCAAAWKAGDMTAVQNGEGAPLSYIRTETNSIYAGQWRMAGNLGFGEFECVIGPNWLEPIEDVPVRPGGGEACTPNLRTARRQAKKPQNKETIMANPIKIETQLLIDGSPLKEFSDDSLFSIISEQEAAIKKYEAIANRPKALEAKIAAIQAGIAALVEAIDTRGPGDKPEA